MDQDYSHAHLIEAALKVIDNYLCLQDAGEDEGVSVDGVALQGAYTSACDYLATLFNRATLDTEI